MRSSAQLTSHMQSGAQGGSSTDFYVFVVANDNRTDKISAWFKR